MMATTSYEITLYTWAGDMLGRELEALLAKAWPSLPEKNIWALVEQMHCFQFQGPEQNSFTSLHQPGKLDEFGLRGRIFWCWGQIEWRRQEANLFRVVVMTEEQTFPAPDALAGGSNFKETTVRWDSELLLWGLSNEDGRFFEQRIQGRDEIEYPEVLKLTAKSMGPGIRPALVVRCYRLSSSGQDVAWRFVEPTLI